jgi:hypothetical protein
MHSRKALREAPAVGVVPDPAAVLENHGVHRADRGGVRRQLGQGGNDALLERMGHVEAAEAQRLSRGNDVAQRRIAQAELIEIHQAVRVVETESGALALMHDGGARWSDPPADQTDQDISPACLAAGRQQRREQVGRRL